MKRFFLFYFVCHICFLCLPSFAQVQDVKFTRMSIYEGLSSPVVLSVIKDSQGFLWFGTMNGLNRYDGYQFRVFVNDPLDSASISDNWINSLCVSRTGDLWLGTQNGGLNRYERSSGKFSSYKKNPDDSMSLTDNRVISLCEDAEGTLWIGTWEGGLCWMESSGNTIHHFKNESPVLSEMNSASINTIKEDLHGDLWIGTAKGLYRLLKGEKRTGGCIRYTVHQNRPGSTGSTSAVKTIYEDSQGALYVGTAESGLYFYDRSLDDLRAFTPGKSRKGIIGNSISCLHEDRDGRLWAGTPDSGLYLIDIKRETCRHICSDNTDVNSLGSNVIFSICEDDAGGMWFGTYQGISSYDQRQKPFITYLYQSNDRSGLSSGYVMDLCEDADGGLWLATHGGGLNYLPYASHTFKHFRHVPTDPASLSTDMLLCLSGNSKDILWIGSRGGGLIKFDKRTKKIKQFFHDPNDPSSIGENIIFYLYEDRKGNLWIGTAREGLDKFDRATEKFVHYRNNPDDSTSLSGNTIWAIADDSKGYIWIGTQRSGLNRLDPRTGRCTRYMNKPGDPESIQSNSIYAIHEYPQGVLWIGTAGGGLSRFDEKTDKFTAYTRKEGLSDNHVGSILHDARGRIWIGTNHLSMLDPQTEKIKNFNEGDGIRCGELNQEAACVGRDGRMYFGGTEGFVVFHPDSIHDNAYIPPVVLTSFKVFEKSRRLPEDSAAGIILSYEENYFSFEFAALSFLAPAKNMYRYKLEGFDNKWISCGTRRYAAYTHVDPGDYVFRVQGSNNDGVWNTAGASVAIHIIPPYWRTLWFRLSLLAAVVFAATFALHRRFKFLKRRTREQQELSRKLLESQEDERKRIGAGLHDSLGQNLLVIKNLAVIGLEAGKNQKSTNEQLAEISQLASQSLAEVREISYNLRPYHLDQLGLTGALRSIISRVASSSHITFSEDMDDVNNLFPKEQEINIFRIIQEAVNNIVKHSQASSTSIQIKRDKDGILCIVSDNGIGFDQNRQGFGLTGMAERVRILGGSMVVKSDSGVGTTLTVTIPFPKDHFRKGLLSEDEIP